MSVKFTVQMTEKYMYDFMLYHTYTRVSGILGAVLGVVGLVVGIQALLGGDTSSALMGFVIAVLFLVVTPRSMKARAKAQVSQTEMFQKPLEYELNETGVIVRQEEQEAVNEWSQIAKAVSTQKCVILYLTRIRALVLPKECMGEQYEAALQMIHTHMPASKVKIRHIH